MKHGGESVVIWAAMSWYSAGAVLTLNGRTTASDYRDILGNQVHPVVQMLMTNNDAVFKMTICRNTQPEVFSPGMSSMKMHFNISDQHNRQT